MRTLLLLLATVGVLAPVRDAAAYPQYQLARDATCTGCHLAPDGGGLLTENGIGVAEDLGWREVDGTFMNGLATPAWLQLGGDVRAAAGYVQPGIPSAAAYPMQADVAAVATAGAFSVHVTGGLRRPSEESALHAVWSREHYVMWRQHPGEGRGLFVRAGRLMPTFGLRLAEHVAYTQRFGGRQLYGEAYAAAASYVTEAFEVHATGFVHDPIGTPTELGDGGALYAEVRLGDHAAIGAEAKYATDDDLDRTYGGVTGKLYVPSVDVNIQAEAQVIHRVITAGAGDTANQIAAYALAAKPLGGGLQLDVGLGHFTQDTRVKGLIRDCVDLNVHFFQTSHIEWLLTTRLELLDAGSGPTGAYALAQLHYRL